MKKSTKIILSTIAIPIVLVALCFIFIEITSERIKTSFADKVIVESKYGAPPFSTEIEIGDANELKEIFNGKRAGFDSPACPCGEVSIIFESENEELILYPAGDGCPTIGVGEYSNQMYFYLSENENNRVKEILIKYGATYPFGI